MDERMIGRTSLSLFLAVGGFMPIASVTAAEEQLAVEVNNQQVHAWNAFASALYELHEHLVKIHDIRSEERIGGYGGLSGGPNFYKEVRTYDAKSGKLLSQIRWERIHPDRIHTIEVFIHDESGRIVRDYSAAYLPVFRNAPFQTLINLHYYNEGLHAYRQFDASDARIYERCKGRLLDQTVNISFDEDQIPGDASLIRDVSVRRAYNACFAALPTSAGPYLNPLTEFPELRKAGTNARVQLSDTTEVERRIERYTRAIMAAPTDAILLVKRGAAYFLAQAFDDAIADYSAAIKLDDRLDEAYFGRGMAYGRAGRLDEGIADLSVFLERNPHSSVAYTKRGVRYIWKGELARAEQDLTRAIALDNSNAEAHDDLGVVYAQQKQYNRAIEHFLAAIRHDRSYQKAYHNLAIVYFVSDQPQAALTAADKALAISPRSRNSLLLKSSILASLGRRQEAEALAREAALLPQADWSERSAIR
jgi:tetratricopeptide (TPR) repeat protein